MGAIQLLRKLKVLNQLLVQEIDDALLELEPFLIQINKEQLDKGEDSEGNFLGTYAPATYEYAERNGRPKRTPDINLFDTGAFRNAIQIEINGNSLLMFSADKKEAMLIEEYGKFIVGIPINRKDEVGKRLYAILHPRLIKILKDA